MKFKDVNWINTFGLLFKIITYLSLIIILFISFYYQSFIINIDLIGLIIILCGYTIIMSLRLKNFQLSPTGISAELDTLEKESEKVAKVENGIKSEVEKTIEDAIEPDTQLLRLSIEIEKTLRNLAILTGIKESRVSMRQLLDYLIQNKTITDKWLIEAIIFISHNRNLLAHEGTVIDIKKAINIGKEVLSHLIIEENNLKNKSK